jgi:hypothetical protein
MVQLKGADAAQASPDSKAVTSGGVKVVNYVDVLKHGAQVGKKVAIIGAGGIGFDVAEYLTHYHEPADGNGKHAPAHAPSFFSDQGAPAETVDPAAVSAYLREWNIDADVTAGGLTPTPQEGTWSYALLP